MSISADPAEILGLLRQGGIDLCISDIDLTAGASGLDIFRQARGEGIAVPFVFLSGHDEGSESMQTALGLGASGVFTKPTDFAVLLEKVCVVLGLAADSVSLAAFK